MFIKIKKSFRAALISYIKKLFSTLESVDFFYENKFGEKLDADKERDINQAKLYLERNTIPNIDTWLTPVFEYDEIRPGHVIYEKEFFEKYLPIYQNGRKDQRLKPWDESPFLLTFFCFCYIIRKRG